MKHIFKKTNPVIAILASALLLAMGYIILNETGSKTGIDVVDKKIFNDVSVDCSELTKTLLSSKLNVKVSNRSATTLESVSVQAIAYDKKGEIIKEKTRDLNETLPPGRTIHRTINFPKKTVKCKCLLITTTTNHQ